MKFSSRYTELMVLGIFVVGVGVVIFMLSGGGGKQIKGVRVNVRVPELSALAIKGEAAFNANCAKCHGKNAGGSGKGPPLVHDLYNPGHHGDQAFFSAANRGVRQHHWPFGNMKALPQVTDSQLTAIVKYVRELQTANGIVTKPHNM